MAGAQPGLAGSEESVQGAVLCMGMFDPYSTSATLLKACLPAFTPVQMSRAGEAPQTNGHSCVLLLCAQPAGALCRAPAKCVM